MKNETLLLITSGKGPEECERVAAMLAERIAGDAMKHSLQCKLISCTEGRRAKTFLSALMMVKGNGVDNFRDRWEGTVQWIASSPFRKNHKRKNWFAGIIVSNSATFPQWNDKDVAYQALRSSGPGGQHVNKTESAVRATHVPTGISVVASDERSQSMNKKAATERLRNKLMHYEMEEKAKEERAQWAGHHSLERGNPKKVIRESLE